MKTVDQFNFKGIRAVIRVDFNVPLNENLEVTDDTRIRAAIPTIHKILKDGGSVVLMSHLGRPKEGPTNKYSLKHIVPELEKQFNKKISFTDDCISDASFEQSASMSDGEILLLENLRFYKEEEKGDKSFAAKLARHGNFYVNDAFGTAHRAHASTTIIAENFDSSHKCFGYVMAGEVENINKVLHQAEKPFTAIIGGAKVSDKILIIEKLMEKADNIIIGGGMAFTFVKAMGGHIGKSLCETDKQDIALSLLEKAKSRGIGFYLPSDAIIADDFKNEANHEECNVNEIPDGWMGLDIGKNTSKHYAEIISQSKTILWNGPMGVFEMSNFEQGTKAVAESIAKVTAKGSYSLIGGGDSVAAINKYHLGNQVSYVSTGGGALLEYIEQGSLPGVKAIED